MRVGVPVWRVCTIVTKRSVPVIEEHCPKGQDRVVYLMVNHFAKVSGNALGRRWAGQADEHAYMYGACLKEQKKSFYYTRQSIINYCSFVYGRISIVMTCQPLKSYLFHSLCYAVKYGIKVWKKQGGWGKGNIYVCMCMSRCCNLKICHQKELVWENLCLNPLLICHFSSFCGILFSGNCQKNQKNMYLYV